MPIYEYRCGECGHQWEKLVLASPPGDPPKCPECGGASEKVLAPSALRFYGPGFFKPNIKKD